jgi:hypothetical protein
MSTILKPTLSWVFVYVGQACVDQIGITRLYELINSGEVESQLMGRRRWINYQSLKRFAGVA